jgi:hypothetical protein
MEICYYIQHKKGERHMNKAELLKAIIEQITPNKTNIDSEISLLRDTFLTAEFDYASVILELDILQKYISVYNEISPETLYQEAMELVEKVELNLIPAENMKKIEQTLIVLLAAIQDKRLIKVLTHHAETEEKTLQYRSK